MKQTILVMAFAMLFGSLCVAQNRKRPEVPEHWKPAYHYYPTYDPTGMIIPPTTPPACSRAERLMPISGLTHCNVEINL